MANIASSSHPGVWCRRFLLARSGRALAGRRMWQRGRPDPPCEWRSGSAYPWAVPWPAGIRSRCAPKTTVLL